MIFNRMRDAAKPLLDQIHHHPFNCTLSLGTLALPKFLFYLHQDAIYLTVYARALAMTAARLPSQVQVKEFIRFALGAIEAESQLHLDFLREHAIFNIDESQQSPACFMYTNYLLKMAAFASVEEAVASLLPCFWVYNEVGKIMASLDQNENNPYARWIALYSSNNFEVSVNLAVNITNELGAHASPALSVKMTNAFLRSMQLEWMFWDSAYRLEVWTLEIPSCSYA
jgi:thiaminase/transcriptional activator TenA